MVADSPPSGGDAIAQVWNPNSDEVVFAKFTNVQQQTVDVRHDSLAEPPWVQGIVLGEKPKNVRPKPPRVGVPQAATIVEIVRIANADNIGFKTHVVCDGVFMDGVQQGDATKFWLPRFREQKIENELKN